MVSCTDSVISARQIGVLLLFLGSFVCFVLKSANTAFGRRSLDQAFSGSEHDNFYTKICAKEVSSNPS